MDYGYLGGAEDYFSHVSHGFYDFRGEQHTPLHSASSPDKHHPNPLKYSTHLFQERAVGMIRHHAAKHRASGRTADKMQPFFLYLPFQAVHDPLEATEEWLQKFSNLSAFNNSQDRATYAAMVGHMDFAVGKVVEALKNASKYHNASKVDGRSSAQRHADEMAEHEREIAESEQEGRRQRQAEEQMAEEYEEQAEALQRQSDEAEAKRAAEQALTLT